MALVIIIITENLKKEYNSINIHSMMDAAGGGVLTHSLFSKFLHIYLKLLDKLR